MIRLFTDPEACDASAAGGKGAALAALTQAGFPVPAGFIVSVEGADDAAVLEAFDRLGAERVAVRSSATREDSDDDSFAGQFDTFLHTTRATLLANVRRCGSSGSSDRVLAYEAARGIPHGEVRVAVVVQKMVDARAAGVCFTANPVTGADDIVIEACWGLGEALVSGAITPDTYVVREGSVQSKSISDQEVRLTGGPEGVREEPVPADARERQKLPDEHILAVAALGRRVEAHAGRPMDLEWAFDAGGVLFLLQARPITTLADTRVRNLLTGPWFTQAGNSVPLFTTATTLGAYDPGAFGTGYRRFLFTCAEEYGEINYLLEDLERVWGAIERRLETEPDCLATHHRRYLEVMAAHEAREDVIDEDLLATFRHGILRMSDALGGHVCEAAAFGLERRLRAQLRHAGLAPADIERRIAFLAVPETPSFMAEEERALRSILDLPLSERDAALEGHRKRFAWIFNSYAGPQAFTLEAARLRLAEEAARGAAPGSAVSDIDDLPDAARHTVELLRLVATMQDERKRRVLVSIEALGRAIDRIAERTGIDTRLLTFLGGREALELGSLDDLGAIDLAARREGMLLLQTADEEILLTGADYIRHVDEGRHESAADGTVLSGSIASTGTAVGRVIICTSLARIADVREGDILVSSMTRPEYLPAMKRAAAFITDEGGITCHAAIIARELRKPCIIGTKIATKTLRDGMLVEVRANHGFIRILDTG